MGAVAGCDGGAGWGSSGRGAEGCRRAEPGTVAGVLKAASTAKLGRNYLSLRRRR